MKAKATVIIHREVEDVFDFLADPRNLLDVNRRGRWEIQVAGPLGPGSTFEAAMKLWLIKPRMTYTVIDYYRPVRLAFRITPQRLTRLLPMRKLRDAEDILEFERVPGGTNLSRVFNWPGYPMIGTGLRRDLRKLKARLESE